MWPVLCDVADNLRARRILTQTRVRSRSACIKPPRNDPDALDRIIDGAPGEGRPA